MRDVVDRVHRVPLHARRHRPDALRGGNVLVEEVGPVVMTGKMVVAKVEHTVCFGLQCEGSNAGVI